MNVNSIGDRLDALRSRLSRLEQIKAWGDEDAGLWEELRQALAAPATNQRAMSPEAITHFLKGKDSSYRVPASGTNYERISSFFVRSGNEWISAPEVGAKLNLSRGTVAHVFWTQHADKFEKKGVPNSVKKKVWRLKPEIYEQLKKTGS